MSEKKDYFIDIDEPPRHVPRTYHAAVGPRGQFVWKGISQEDIAQNLSWGHCPLQFSGGMPSVHPYYQEQGWVLYEDLCYGRVAGVEASPAHFIRWRKALAALEGSGGKNKLPQGIAQEHHLHPEVLRRREPDGHVGGISAVDFVAWGEETPSSSPKQKRK